MHEGVLDWWEEELLVWNGKEWRIGIMSEEATVGERKRSSHLRQQLEAEQEDCEFGLVTWRTKWNMERDAHTT